MFAFQKHLALAAVLMPALLAGCTGGRTELPGTPVAPMGPSVPSSIGSRPSWFRQAPALLKNGVYIATYFDNEILAYDYFTQKQNLPPVCEIQSTFVVDVATDKTGRLIDPDGGSRQVSVYGGPAICGPLLGTFADPYGQPSDAATHDATSDTIYVANLQATNQAYGNVSVCTLMGGCTRVLGNPAIAGQLFAVAEDTAGNVYASGYALAAGKGAKLVLWKAGKGNGAVVHAYRNLWPGGLDFDANGNLLAVDTFAGGTGALYVYSGCPAACTAHGPFLLKGESVYGKVNAAGTIFEAADFEYGQIDVYRYNGTKGISYLYSFSDGLDPEGDVEGIAIDPAAED